jgi:hypothetical protein
MLAAVRSALQALDWWDRGFHRRIAMFVCYVGSGLCDELLTRSKSPAVCVRACVPARPPARVCVLENYDEATSA